MFLSCDKGNKKGIDHFPKVLLCWSFDELQIRTFLLDVDGSDGTSEAVTDAIHNSTTNKINKPNFRYRGAGTDSGGGGVTTSLHNAMKEKQLCGPIGYLVADCTTHGFQRAYCNAMMGKVVSESAILYSWYIATLTYNKHSQTFSRRFGTA